MALKFMESIQFMIYNSPKDKDNENKVVSVEDVQESNFGYTEDSHGTRSKGINENNLSKQSNRL